MCRAQYENRGLRGKRGPCGSSSLLRRLTQPPLADIGQPFGSTDLTRTDDNGDLIEDSSCHVTDLAKTMLDNMSNEPWASRAIAEDASAAATATLAAAAAQG